MVVYLPVWHSLHKIQVHCCGIMHWWACSSLNPLLCLQRQIAKLVSALFYYWPLLRNNNMATHFQRFTSVVAVPFCRMCLLNLERRHLGRYMQRLTADSISHVLYTVLCEKKHCCQQSAFFATKVPSKVRNCAVPPPDRTVARKSSIGGLYVFSGGLERLCRGLKRKNSIYSISYFNLGVLGSFSGGAKPTKATPWRRGCHQTIVAVKSHSCALATFQNIGKTRKRREPIWIRCVLRSYFDKILHLF